MSEAKGVERSLEGLARRLLLVNLAAISTTSLVSCFTTYPKLRLYLYIEQTFIQILYRLLANPGYLEPLRQEIEAAVAEEGWTKAGMDKLHRLDSFVRETQRTDIISPSLSASIYSCPVTDTVLQVGLARIAIRPFTFSNGVTIPAGTMVAAPSSAIHVDEEIYSNPERFDGFRFSGPHDNDGNVARTGKSAVSTAPDYLAFGLGRHVW